MVRVKNRYLVVKLLYPAPATPSSAGNDATAPVPALLQFHAPTSDVFHTGHLLRMVRDALTELFGDYGLALVNTALKINYWSPATSTAILRCPRDHFRMLWAALTFITKLPKPIDTPVIFKVLRVSGTIRKAEEEVIARARLIIRRARTLDVKGRHHIIDGVVKAVDKRMESENIVLDPIDDAHDSESTSE